METTLLNKLHIALTARENCIKIGNETWRARWEALIARIERESLPSGAGFNAGSQIDIEACTDDKMIFQTAFHHMDANGYYNGWTRHAVIVTPAFSGFNIHVTGRNKNEIKEYIEVTFYAALSAPCNWDA